MVLVRIAMVTRWLVERRDEEQAFLQPGAGNLVWIFRMAQNAHHRSLVLLLLLIFFVAGVILMWVGIVGNVVGTRIGSRRKGVKPAPPYILEGQVRDCQEKNGNMPLILSFEYLYWMVLWNRRYHLTEPYIIL